MSEITVTIFNRNYRLAVTQGEEELLRECAKRVDSQIQQLRSGGKIVSADQLAVLTALEIAYESEKKKASAEKTQFEDSEEPKAQSAQQPEAAPEQPRAEPSGEEIPAPNTEESRGADEETEALLQIKELCLLCEKAILRNSTIGSLF